MYMYGVGNQVPVNLEAAALWKKTVDEKENLLKLEAEMRQKQDEEQIRALREESDYLAFQKFRREEEWKRRESEAKLRRNADGSFATVMNYLDWGYYMLAIDELCSMARMANVDAQEYIDPDASPMPRDKKYSGPAMYSFGEYFAKRSNFEYAVGWFRNAAEVGHEDAMVTYAAYLITGKGLECADPGHCVVWLMKAWNASSNAEAALALGDAFSKGTGVSPDPEKSVIWYTRAWTQGNFVEAAFSVGLTYATGYPPGFPASAKMGHGVGVVSESGVSSSASRSTIPPVPRNFETAVKWYETAARHGHARSSNNLGEMFMMGRGVLRNDYVGLNYFKRAANASLPEAMYNVGRCFRDGRGCSQNERTALEWFKKAEELGVKEASLAISESPLVVGENP